MTGADLAAPAAAAITRIDAGSTTFMMRIEMLRFVVQSGVDRAALTSGQTEALRGLLGRTLPDDDWLVRGWTVEAVGRYGSVSDSAALYHLAVSDPHPWVRADAIEALYDINRRRHDRAVARVLADEDEAE